MILLFSGVFPFQNFLAAEATVSTLVDIKSKDNRIELVPFLEVFADPNNHILPDAIVDQPFSRLDVLKVEPNIHTYWVRGSLQNHLNQNSKWRLHLFDNWCEEVVIFTKMDTSPNTWAQSRSGYMHPSSGDKKSNQQLAHLPNSFQLELLPNTTTQIYIRYTKVMRLDLHLNLFLEPIIAAANQQVSDHKHSYYTLAIMGMFFILSIYHFIVFWMVRDMTYLYYALYGMTAVVATTVDDEHLLVLYDLFYTNNTALQPWIFMWSGPLVIIFYTLFTRTFLNTSSQYPILDRALRFMVWMLVITLGVVSVNFVLTGRQYIPGLRFEYQFIIIAVIFVLILYKILQHRRKSEMFYVWGIGILLAILLPRYIIQLLGMNDNWIIDWHLPISNIQLGILAELLLFAVGIGYRTRTMQLEKQRIEEIDGLKSRFFEDISHEFRTPLTLIMGPLQQLQTKLKSPADQSIISLALDQAKRLLGQVNQVLSLSKLEARQVALKVGEQNIIAFAKGIFYSFESLADAKKISLKSNINVDAIPLYFDHSKMESIISNLVSNAIKHTPEGGEISLTINDYKQEIEISIIDSGIGIETSDIPNVFNRYYSVGNQNQVSADGYGIGLALVRELVRLHHGQVSLSSEIGKGSAFTLRFQKGRQHFKDQDMDSNLDYSIEVPDHAKSETLVDLSHVVDKTKTDLPELLIIDDNADVRNFLRILLTDHYIISEAEDGVKGIQVATEQLPDLIICDVAMPLKDGYEVCNELKNTIATSHIPIILLTAKAEQEQRIEGLLKGADAYLTKPFDSEELKIRITNLIQQRETLKKKWTSTSEDPDPIETHAPLDQEFLNSVLEFIKVNMSREDLDVEMIGREIGLSSRQLNRKLKALTDKTGSQLISHTRLKEAANLLKKDSHTIAEITYATGHTSSSYFSTVFRKEYGVTPSQYRSKK